MPRWLRLCRAIAVSMTLGLLLGCAHSPTLETSISAAETEHILQGGVFFPDSTSSDFTEDVDLLGESVLTLNDDMRLFVDLYVDTDVNSGAKLRQLLKAIFHGGMLGLEYDPLKTYSAADTFYFQQGNCLSFTNMFVALGREAGLKVWFNEVKVPPTWDMQSASTHVYYRHMNAVVQTTRGRHIIDLNMENYDLDYPQQRVSDDYAMAQFFNNRAMELLFEERWQASFRHLRAALELQPEQAFLWGNLGSLYRRAQHFPEAELAFLKSLELDSRNLMAMSNLSRLYRQLGRESDAETFENKVVYHRRNNPYYRYYQAQQALDSRQLVEAFNHVKAAIDGYDKDHRFHFLAAKVSSAQGDLARAQKYLQRATQLTKDQDQKDRYNHKLDTLAAR
ncbi:MAG: tetratricopeptide repeat protein [Cellvibrionaceae bacterium]